jgi:hypothetical protein
MKKKRKDKEKPILGIGWYEENQWDLLLRHAVDKEDLEPTYADWLEGITVGIQDISKSQTVRKNTRRCRRNDSVV